MRNLKTCLVRSLQVWELPWVKELEDSQRNVNTLWHDKLQNHIKTHKGKKKKPKNPDIFHSFYAVTKPRKPYWCGLSVEGQLPLLYLMCVCITKALGSG